MSIRFYSTTVSAEKTAGEIQEILANSSARRVMTSYDDDGQIERLEFTLKIGGQPLGFRLEPNVEGMRKALNQDEDTPGSFDLEDARQTAWRLHKAWLETALAFRDARQASVDQLLLGFAVTPDGATVHDRLIEDQNLLAPPEQR